MKKRVLFVLQSIIGLALLLTGSVILTSEEVKMVSGLCIGIGAVMLALGIGELIRSFMLSALEDEKFKKIKAVEVNDERNIRIKEKAGHMTAKFMNYALSLFIIALGFMGADKLIIILAAALIVIELILFIFFSNYYSRKM